VATSVNSQKKVDVPAKGGRNADPITGAPGSHPVETGVGAAAAGAASGLTVGAFTGPVGAVVGAAVGAVAGGYAGKDVGEMIDPTSDDSWLRDNFASRPYVKEGDTFEKYEPAYRYGGEAESRYGTDRFEVIENKLKSDWHQGEQETAMPWKHARDAVRDSYERTREIRRGRDAPEETDDLLEDLEF
jgi:hypothetical protein